MSHQKSGALPSSTHHNHNKKHKRFNRNDKFKRYKLGQCSGEILQNLEEKNCRTLDLFREFGGALDGKNDRYERIVKVSRDITIESKRIIFSLHSTATDVSTKRQTLLDETKLRIEKLAQVQFQSIAIELDGIDPYPYHRAYSSGIEEFVEAVLFYYYVTTGNIIDYKQLNESYFKFTPNSEEIDTNEVEVVPVENTQQHKILFTMVDFILGMADFTGELMRKSINSLSSGQPEECFKTLALCREIQVGFMSVNCNNVRGVFRKYNTLKQSVAKMEQVCYTICVRGNEIPTGILMDVIDNRDKKNMGDDDDDVDEGIF